MGHHALAIKAIFQTQLIIFQEAEPGVGVCFPSSPFMHASKLSLLMSGLAGKFKIVMNAAKQS